MINLSMLVSVKYRLVSFFVKNLSAVAFPIAIVKAYGAGINGDVQLLIATTAYLGLLDSGMTISALNRGEAQSSSHQENPASILRNQIKSSKKIVFIGIAIASIIIFWASSKDILGSTILFAGSLLAAISVLEVALTPFKYHLYSYGLANAVEKREALLSTACAFALSIFSVLILFGFVPLVFGLPIGLILLRADRAISGVASLSDLQAIIAVRNANKTPFKQPNPKPKKLSPYSHQVIPNEDRAWIFSLQILAMLNWSTDLFLIKLVGGATAVSDYSIYIKLFMLPAALVSLAYPVIQSAVSQGKLKVVQFSFLVRVSWVFIVVAGSSMAVTSNYLFKEFPFLINVIGLTEPPSLYLLACFSFYCVLFVVARLYAPVANGLRLFRYQVIVCLIFLPLNLSLSLLLGKYYGLQVVGVVGATCLTMALTSCFIVPRKILGSLALPSNIGV